MPASPRGIVELFHARFDPRAESGRSDKQNAIAARLEEGLQKVESLDEDRILRHFINAVQSAIRTNFYQTDKDGRPKSLISVKFESRKLTICRCRVRSTKFSSIHRGSKACIYASARLRAAASAGRTGRRISVPRFSDW